MVPVLGIPVINRMDLLAKCVMSIDHPVGRLVIVDNSPLGDAYDAIQAAVERKSHLIDTVFVTEPPANLGFAASVNLVITTNQHEPWWCIANADTEFGPGDLANLAAEMEKPGPRWVGVTDWRLFGLNFECVEKVGLWDPNFHPAFVEDVDYDYRCHLSGVPYYQIPGTTTHLTSTSLTEPRYNNANNRSYPANVRYYARKWGGALRGHETFTTPFNSGASVATWTLDLRRLRDNDWG